MILDDLLFHLGGPAATSASWSRSAQPYADCSFTVFPSFFEGWGLPVTESLSMGRPCVASSTTSIPEAGGSLAHYFNPCDTNDAYRLIHDTISNQPALGEWTEQVRSRFKPIPWTDSARAVLAAFDSLI